VSVRFYKQADNEWVEPKKMKGYPIACCDCGLVHRFDFRVSDEGKVQFRARRDRKETLHRRAYMERRKRREPAP
jgi:hypothetical protein